MTQADRSRTPQQGDTLILADGRRFVMSTALTDVRGWWFTATALDGGSTLQGNISLEWDAQASAWRPFGVRAATAAPPAAARWTTRNRLKQLD